MAKNWEFFLKEIPITKRLQKKEHELGVVGWLVGSLKARWGEAAPVPVGCNGRKGYERRNRGKERGRKKSPNTIPKTKQKKQLLARAGQMESLVGFGILFFFISPFSFGVL